MHMSNTHESPCLCSIQRLHIIKLFWQRGKANLLQVCSRDLTSSGRLHKSSTQWLLLGSGNTPCTGNNEEHGEMKWRSAGEVKFCGQGRGVAK